jgi:hypothetical protein
MIKAKQSAIVVNDNILEPEALANTLRLNYTEEFFQVDFGSFTEERTSVIVISKAKIHPVLMKSFVLYL